MVRLDVTRFGHHRLAVVEDHHRGGLVGVVLGRDINPVCVLGSRENVARNDFRSDELALGHPVHGFGIGSQSVVEVVRIIRGAVGAVAGGQIRGRGSCGFGFLGLGNGR